MKISNADDIDHHFQAWKEELGIHKIIAFSWGSSAEKVQWANTSVIEALNESVRDYVNSIIEGSMKRLADFRIGILTGGTEGGVPEDAAKIAKTYGLPTIGVYPSRGKKRALSSDILDCSIEIGSAYGESMWWDESPVFAKLSDACVVLGWGAGTLIEASHILKINECLLDKGKRPKYIVPISGIPGVGSHVQMIPGKTHVKSVSFPHHEIKTGQQVADYLERQLSLEDDHKDNVRK